MNDQHLEQVAALLVQKWSAEGWAWRWLTGTAPEALTQQSANKFLLACILDYQVKAEVAWNNAQRLAEKLLGDPDDLWAEITKGPLDEWMARRDRYRLHRFPKGHERVYTIGKRIVAHYSGDARGIWRGRSIEDTSWRLNDLGVGPQLSRMIVGALIDTGHLSGRADVKVDIHIRRVLGRLLRGAPFNQDEGGQVIELTRAMYPENPWLLDRPVYQLGKSQCRAKAPKCGQCWMRPACQYGSRHS